ncbi:ribonuclease E/G [Pseudooceanicola aestuarii]|uniref:ribonuclease E/G n=1 Tax=Pseudooceanicola aestuarii TaxID=2697319 RepID=UPI0013D89ABA|nr:ribonuclease E/G [Pseudooceanicola aestuarii]
MKGFQIALDTLPRRDGERAEAAALLEDGQLSDLLIDTDDPRPGTIYRALTDRPVKGQGGMFLKTPDGPAFLRQVKGLAPGQPILVQVSGHAEPGKAIPVTARLLFKSRYAIVTPGAPGINISRAIRDEEIRVSLNGLAHDIFPETEVGQGGEAAGLILRSACAAADEDAVAEDIAMMADLAARVLGDAEGAPEKLLDGPGPHDLAWRDWPQAQVEDATGSFATLGVDEMIAALRGGRVPLPGAGTMFVEPTRACVAVDVNTGADTSPAAGLKANIAAARALPRQLRLRGLGGLIYLDLAPFPKRERKQLESALKAALRGDDVETTVSGWSVLGNLELQRKRARLPLAPILAGLSE